jgi:hypothetical protein
MKMHREERDIKSKHEKLQQLNQLVALSNGAYLHIDFEENDSAFEELARHIRGKRRPEIESVRTAYYLGTLAGVNYRDLRHLQLPEASELVQKEFEKAPALKPLLELAKNDTVRRPGNDLLDDLLGEEPKNELSDVLAMLAKKRPEQTIELRPGEQVAVTDLYRSINSAVQMAAFEAKESSRDQETVEAPLIRLSNAIQEANRAKSSLQRARTFAEWSENTFQNKVKELRDLVESLGTRRG